MNFEMVIDGFGVYFASFLVGFASGLIPIIYAEVYLLIIPAVSQKSQLLPVAMITATAHMFAKAVLFYVGQGALKISIAKYKERLRSFNKRFPRFAGVAKEPIILLSAAVGYPPFYLVSIAAGAIRLNFVRFFTIGWVGRSIRFSAIIFFPSFIQGLHL